MNKDEFAIKFGAVISEPGVTRDTDLDTLDGWDSLGQMTFIAFVRRNFGMVLNVDKMRCAKTVSDLYDVITGG